MRTLVVQGDWLLKKCHFANLPMRVDQTSCGGIVGFMVQMRQALISRPTDKIVVVWDGVLDGLAKYDRYPVLKALKQAAWDDRIRIQRAESFDLSRKDRFGLDILAQRAVLQRHLEALCVRQMEEETSEAMDAIALYVNEAVTVGEQVTILAREHEFHQLISDEVHLLRFDGTVVDKKNFFSLYHYDVSNDLMLKCFIGMPSGVPGVPGLSLGRMLKYLPGLKLEQYPYGDLIAYCRRKRFDVPLKIYDAVLSGHEVVARNAKLINQRDPIFNSDLNQQKNYCLYSPLNDEGGEELYREYRMYERHIGDPKEFLSPFQRIILKEKEYTLFHEQVNI